MEPLTGIYGGSFDPVHLGHVRTLQELQQRLPMPHVRVLPAALSPLKTRATPALHRLAMLELTLAGMPGLEVDDRELHRPGPSYTIDTLRELRASAGASAPLVFIMGLDSFLQLPRWRDWRNLVGLAHLLVVSRPGFAADFSPELSEWLKIVQSQQVEMLQCAPSGHVLLLETRPWPIASRDIRAALARGDDMTQQLPAAVWEYIQHHKLYQPEPTQPNESD